MFFSFLFLYHVLVKLQNKENFSDEYKLMVASCVVLFSYCCLEGDIYDLEKSLYNMNNN